MKKKRLFLIIQLILIIYGLIGIGLFYLQDKFLFHPEPVEPDFKYAFSHQFTEQYITVNEHYKIHLVKIMPQGKPRGLILFFHGNMKNVGYYQKNISSLVDLGFEVWMPDYPGFGKSIGDLNEQNLNTLAVQTQRLATAHISADSIILFGKSLGTGPAAYAAANSINKMLILETPYSSIPSLFRTYAWMYPVGKMCHFKLPVIDYLKDVKYPIVIFHGDADKIIPLKEAEKLKQVLKPGDKFITIPSGHHNDLKDSDLYKEELKRW